MSEFIRQSRAFAKALERENKLAACREIPGKNRFEILDGLADPEQAVAQYVLKLFGESDAACRPSNEISI